MSRNYTPTTSSTSDGSDLTLCKILDVAAGTHVGWDQIDLSNYTDANPGTVEYTIGGNVVQTLTLTWDGDNLTSVVRS